jgi:hypothetical protein
LLKEGVSRVIAMSFIEVPFSGKIRRTQTINNPNQDNLGKSTVANSIYVYNNLNEK